MHVERNLAISTKENVAYTLDEELRTIPPRRLPPIPEDKLHRVSYSSLNYLKANITIYLLQRNPHTVRQEIKMFDAPVSDTTLADVHLTEMPGLHNTGLSSISFIFLLKISI